MKTLASYWRFVFLAFAVSQLLANCMTDTTQPNLPVAADQPAYTAQTNETVTAGQLATPAAFAGGEISPADYRIAARDILQIAVFQVQDLNNVVQVSEDGNVTLPLVGKIQVRGRTTYEAEQIIADKLRQKYLQSPQVTVSVKEFGKRITVSGEVKGPRVLADDGNTTLTQAIANAGGVGDLANSTRVHIARSRNQQVQDETYNLDEIQAGQVRDPLLRGGDIVVVEQAGTKVALKTVSSLLPFAVLAALW
jgi:polysaccharide export outer membrane protein